MMEIKGKIRSEYRDIFADGKVNKIERKSCQYKVETLFCQKTVQIDVFKESDNDDDDDVVVIRRTKKWR